MKNPYSHIILYAKGWYKITNTIEDLKVLVSNLYGWDVEHCSLDNITRTMINIIYKCCIENNKESEYNFKDLLQDIHPNNV